GEKIFVIQLVIGSCKIRKEGEIFELRFSSNNISRTGQGLQCVQRKFLPLYKSVISLRHLEGHSGDYIKVMLFVEYILISKIVIGVVIEDPCPFRASIPIGRQSAACPRTKKALFILIENIGSQFRSESQSVAEFKFSV